MHTLSRRFVQIALPLIALCVMTVVPSGQAERNARPDINQSDDPVLGAFRFRSIGPASMGGRIDDIEVSRERPEHHLHRLRGRRRVQVDEQRHDVRARLRDVRQRVDRRHRHPSDESQHRLRRHGRAEQPADVVVRRRHLQDDRRRQDVHATSASRKRRRSRASSSIRSNPERCTSPSPGHLFGPSPDRGIYKTTDGGKTWNKIKFIDDEHRLHRHRDRSVEQQRALRGELSAPAQRLLLQRRRAGQRALEDRRTPARRGRSSTSTACRRARTAASRSTSSRSNPNVVYAQIEAGETGTPERTTPRRGAAPPRKRLRRAPRQ